MIERSADEWNRWLTEFSREADSEAWRGIMCFLRWIQIRAQNGHPIPDFLPALEGDIYHSQLLRRMLAGKEPLAYPPPERKGEPWYELAETGEGFAESAEPWEWAPETKMNIDQGIWTIAEKRSSTEYVVMYRMGGESYLLTPREAGGWSLRRLPT